MSKKELTPWFDGDVKPVRVGVYQRKVDSGFYYCHWDGSIWCFGGGPEPHYAWTYDSPAFNQSLPWRGLASRPR